MRRAASGDESDARTMTLRNVLRAALRSPSAACAAGVRIVRRGFEEGAGGALQEFHRTVANVSPVSDYARWVRGFESSRCVAARRSPAQADAWMFSLILPVCDPRVSDLEQAIDSVRVQRYENWQLCIVDDASSDPAVEAVLERAARADARIRVLRRPDRGHISRASNDALALATGTHVAFLDHDDVLAPDALERVAEHVARNPRHRLAYTDEDKLDPSGRRCEPYFKPEWDPELLRGQNYLCHLVVCERALVDAVGGLRTGFEGAQDHDLWLRCTERLRPDEIGHVPRVLYHWRMSAASTATSGDAKPYAVAAARRAIEEHLARTGAAGRVETVPGGHFRVARTLVEPAPRVSIVVPTRDRIDLVRRCVESVRARTSYSAYELVIVDNASVEVASRDYFAALEQEGAARVVRYDAPFNYSAVNNHAVRRTTGDIVVLLNNDVEVIDDGWLRELVSHAARPEIGCVGAMLYYPDDTIQHAGIVLGIGGVAGHAYPRWPRGSAGYFNRARLVQSMSAVTGACLAVRRCVFEEVGGLDETFGVAFNDVDFCLRVRARGYRNLWTPYAELYHHESASRGYEDTPEKKRRFDREVARMIRRWGRVLRTDPAYNINLSLVTEPFTLSPTGPRWRDFEPSLAGGAD